MRLCRTTCSARSTEAPVLEAPRKIAAPRVRDEILRTTAASELPISSAHALGAASLPLLHKDPFDRMLVAQALAEGLVVVTADAAVRQYGVPTQWAL